MRTDAARQSQPISIAAVNAMNGNSASAMNLRRSMRSERLGSGFQQNTGIRAQSCPETNTVLRLFDCSASRSNEFSADGESLDSEDSANFESPRRSEHSRRCKQKEDFCELFSFLDDAHALGYTVEQHRVAHTHSLDCADNGGSRRRAQSGTAAQRSVRLRAPSFERCATNGPLFEQRALRYATYQQKHALRSLRVQR